MTDAEGREAELVEHRVTYTLELDGRFYLVENVPARVDPDTGEPLFAPQTVEQLQRIIRGGEPPIRMIETPVYQFAG